MSMTKEQLSEVLRKVIEARAADQATVNRLKAAPQVTAGEQLEMNNAERRVAAADAELVGLRVQMRAHL